MPRTARFAAAIALLLGLLAALPGVGVLAAASLTASPQDVPFGQFTTTIAFSTGGAAGTVCVAANGAAENPFASDPTGTGSAPAPFIQSGSYSFTLHAGSGCGGQALAATTVHKLTPDGTTTPSITVAPPAFDVAPGILTRTATVNWDGGTGAAVTVTVAVNGGTPITFAMASYGSAMVPWVQSGAYAFALGAKVATVTARSGIVATPAGGAAPQSVQLTANSGNGAPVLICLQSGGGGLSIPFALGNSGVVQGTIVLDAAHKGANVFTAFRSADGKTPLTAAGLMTGTGGAQCTANTPLMVVPNPDASPAQVIVTIT
ncbi:MAG: hypothetical protein M3176_13675 [Chloroflexota bacterium]|nr:hypothetical protein [Chloroflexota bacterium]